MIHWFRTSRISDSNHKIRSRAMAAHSAVFFVVFIALHQTDSVFSCTVTPSASANLSGTNISIACRPESGESVLRWRRQNENTTFYFALFGRTNRSVSDGYSVDDSNPNEIILTLINASILYVDSYECNCLNPTTAVLSRGYTNISVVETEPQLFTNNSLSSDEPVAVMCSLQFAGNASVLMQITNSAGNVLSELKESISTNVSQQFNLFYNTSTAIGNKYCCNISLVNEASDQKTKIFSRNLTRTVQFSVRNVSISPESPEQCISGGLCYKNSVILCKAEGSPEPSYNFTIYQNGTIVRSLANQQKYTTEFVGQQIIQCTASNVISGIVYSNSTNFTTNGTEAGIALSSTGPNVPLIVGLVVGLLLLLILIIIIIIIIIFRYYRQKNQQPREPKTEDAIETKDFTKENKGNKGTNLNGQTNLAVTSGDERVLIDNTLYSGTKGGGAAYYNTAIDPSDGGYAAIDELGTHRKG